MPSRFSIQPAHYSPPWCKWLCSSSFCPGSWVSLDLQHLSVGTSTCGLGWTGTNGVKSGSSAGCTGMRTLRSKPGAWYSGTVWFLSFSKENQSNRNTWKMAQFSTQHSDLRCLLSARKILPAKGGTAWTSVPAFPKAQVCLPLSQQHLPACGHAQPAACSAVPIPGAALCRQWEAAGLRLGRGAAASSVPLACTKGSPSALLFPWLPVLLCY